MTKMRFFLILFLVIKSSVGNPQLNHHIYHLPPSHPPAPSPTTQFPPFPLEFSFGVASGAPHIEGTWNGDGRGESIWDRWVHYNTDVVIDNSDADVTSDAYHHLQEDVEILDNLTVRHYKFSLSWSRILPNGYGEINTEGVRHYQTLLQLLKKHRIEPIVTLYHGDLPQALQDRGGFLCDDFPQWYTEYARIVFENFGSSVRYWITFNSPGWQCNGGYGDGTHAPGVSENPGVDDYICGHNLLKAHAGAYRLYDAHYRHLQKGKISIAIESPWFEPDSDCQTDRDAAETKLQFQIGWWAHPIYLGDYPPTMINRIGQLSELQGLPRSRLPVFTRKEIDWIKDTHDFFSFNFLQTVRVKAIRDDYVLAPSYNADIGVQILPQDGDVTFGIRKLILWLKYQYHNPSILVSQDGIMTPDRELEDDRRITYIHDILSNIRMAMLNDEARVYGYTYYSYIDGWEYLQGYTEKWGLYDIDFECDEKTRTPKKSAGYYQFVCKYGCINDPCPPRHHYPAL